MVTETSNQTRLESRPHYSGPAFLGVGFRPLFLLAGLWAALSVPLWVGIWSGAVAYTGPGDAIMWHVHEMMFGYVGAALGGFLLTAVANWTGRPPVCGWPLGALALIWLGGRIAVWWGGSIGALATAVIDLAYLGALSVLVGNEIVAGRNWRNLPVLAGLALMLAANALFHLYTAGVADVRETGIRLSIAAMSLLLAFIGGRIVPNFTRNWFAPRAGPQIAQPMARFDQVTLAVTALALAAWVGSAPVLLSGTALSLAGALNCARLARWHGWSTTAEPLITVLHVGYLWLALGLGLLGISLLGDRVAQPLALHVLTLGAMGTMTLAVMSRAILGHTGRELHAGPWLVAIYALATLAVLTRAAFEMAPTTSLLWATAATWSLAFVLFTGYFTPMLFRPRKG